MHVCTGKCMHTAVDAEGVSSCRRGTWNMLRCVARYPRFVSRLCNVRTMAPRPTVYENYTIAHVVVDGAKPCFPLFIDPDMYRWRPKPLAVKVLLHRMKGYLLCAVSSFGGRWSSHLRGSKSVVSEGLRSIARQQLYTYTENAVSHQPSWG